MKKILFVFLGVFLLSGCTTLLEKEQTKTPTQTATPEHSMEHDNMNHHSEYQMQTQENPEQKVIEINASRWEFDKPEIRVQKGENILLKINNLDTTHNIDIPKLSQSGSEILLDTSTAGAFEFLCAQYCGKGHHDMKGVIIIQESQCSASGEGCFSAHDAEKVAADHSEHDHDSDHH